MPHRRSQSHAAPHNSGTSTFDRITLHAFMLAVTVAAAVVLGYGPAAAMHHIAEVVDEANSVPMPDGAAWSGGMVF